MAVSNNKHNKAENLSQKQAILAGIPYMVTKQFPWRLHEMLEQVEKNGKEFIVSWLPSGSAFKVHRHDLFVEEIMKNHFQQTKYKSFQRQLNLWGFERNTKESLERGSYYHPLFTRGRKDLCQEMARQKVKPEFAALNASNLSSNEAAAANASGVPQTVSIVSNSSSNNSATSSSNDALESIQNGASATLPSQLLMNMMVAATQQQQQQNQLSELQRLLSMGSAPSQPPQQLQQQHLLSAVTSLLRATTAGNPQTVNTQQQPDFSSLLLGNAAFAGSLLNIANNSISSPSLPATSSNPATASALIQALREQSAAPKPAPAGNQQPQLTPLQQLLLGGASNSEQQQQNGVFFSTAYPHRNAAVAPPVSNTNSIPLSNADILQALQKRAALASLASVMVNGGNSAAGSSSASNQAALSMLFQQQQQQQ